MTRAREPDHEGHVERDGVRVHYEVHGDGSPTFLLLPTWTIVDKRFWKLQVPYLARHHRVVTYDGPGNGLSDRPTDPRAYDPDRQVAHLLDVLDATGTEQAVLVGLSRAAEWALQVAAEHPSRVLAAALIGSSLPLTELHPRPTVEVDVDRLPLSEVPRLGTDPPAHWLKHHPSYWERRYEDFLWFFFGQCFPEPRSTKPIEDCVGWALGTSPEVLIAEGDCAFPSLEQVEAWCRQVRCPVLVVHGDHDTVSPFAVAERLTGLTGGDCVVVEGGGHIPLARDPVKVNHLLHELGERVAPQPRARTWTRGRSRRPRVLYLSSPIGLGHARRDLAIARALRELREDVEVDWLTQHPVTAVLEQAGERVHPASRWLASESRHIEEESGEHDLHCFQALRRMDEILVNNFHVFDDVVREGAYDLVVGDEAWDVDHFLHENPELKRFAYAWMTDFVGFLPMPDGGEREALVAADHNAQMIEQVERFPWLRDRAVFVGDPEDIVPDSFGPDLPAIRAWTEAHFDFPGYVTGTDPVEDRAGLRASLGWSPDEQVVVVSVGGSGVGGSLVRRTTDAYDAVRALVPGLRMVVVTGPRLDPSIVAPRPGLEVHGYVPDLHRHLAACDLAVVQGGLTTTMELTAAGRPFLFVPLRHHFEQQRHVRHRLERYAAGRHLDYDDACDPDLLAKAIADHLGAPVDYRPVRPGGAERAAALLAELL